MSKPQGQRIAYTRVSSVDQNLARQLDGIEVDRTFSDHCSGKDTNRPGLQQALVYVREGDTLVCHSMDRLGRSTEDLLRIVRELRERGVTVEFMTPSHLVFSPDKRDAMAELMMTMLAAVATFERSLIRERQREGIALAKAKGKYRGRKRSLNPDEAREAIALANAGIPKADVARQYGVSRMTLYSYLRAAA